MAAEPTAATTSTPAAEPPVVTSTTSTNARAYAIDFISDASGKHIKSSKYRVLFRFGFSPNQYPVLEHEHVVTLSWSANSGKAILAADGRDVHMTKNVATQRKGLISSPKIPSRKKEAKFEHSWDLVSTDSEQEQSHSLRIVAHSRGSSQQQQLRQFDLFIDDVSYFDLPRCIEGERIPGFENNIGLEANPDNPDLSSSGSQSSSLEEAKKPTEIRKDGEGVGDASWLDIAIDEDA